MSYGFSQTQTRNLIQNIALACSRQTFRTKLSVLFERFRRSFKVYHKLKAMGENLHGTFRSTLTKKKLNFVCTVFIYIKKNEMSNKVGFRRK